MVRFPKAVAPGNTVTVARWAPIREGLYTFSCLPFPQAPIHPPGERVQTRWTSCNPSDMMIQHGRIVEIGMWVRPRALRT